MTKMREPTKKALVACELLLNAGCVVDVGLSQSTLLSPVNVLTPLTAGATAATSAAKPPPSYTNVCTMHVVSE